MADRKSVYLALSADVLHRGHLNILDAAAGLGEVTVGLLTDEAIATYKRLPVIDYQTRAALVGSLRQVARVVEQGSLSYAANLRRLRPDYVVHGDDWRTGVQASVRAEVVAELATYGGELVEVPYTTGASGTELDASLRPLLNTPDIRRAKLRRLIALKPWVRAIEASNGLSGLIVENLSYADEGSMMRREFDAMWLSSLCDSTFKGKPDIELVDFTSRLQTIDEIMEVTTKPLIVDGDTGGLTEHFVHTAKTLERVGVSAVIIEDKTGLKKNSLFGTSVAQVLDDPVEFSGKINAAKQALTTRDFMVIARCESLIAGLGLDDALSRAQAYVGAGADGIMIHSKEKDPAEILAFCAAFRQDHPAIPLVLVPTTYNAVREEELAQAGASIIIHANHLLRSAYPAMVETATEILREGRSLEADSHIMPIKDVLSIIPE